MSNNSINPIPLDSPKELAPLPKRRTQAKEAEEPNYDSMSFSKAFASARKAGATTFKWKGKLYGTKLDPNYKSRWGLEDKPQVEDKITKKDNPNYKSRWGLEDKPQVEDEITKKDKPQVEDKITKKDNPKSDSFESRTFSNGPFKNVSTEEDVPIKKRKEAPTNKAKHKMTLRDYVKLGINGIKRKISLWNADDDAQIDTSFMDGDHSTRPIKDRRPPIMTGDTLHQSDRRYSLPEVIDLNRVTLGYRNRGDLTPIRTSAGIITAFNPFTLRKDNSIDGSYIGITPEGKFKVGRLADFDPEDRISKVYSQEVFRIHKNGDDYVTNTARKNKHLDTPVVTIRDDNGNLRDTNFLNILVPKGDTTGKTYGNATGGRVVIKVGDELMLVSGSLDTINNVFEEMKKRNNADSGYIYTLDNGTYGRAIRTYDEEITEDDLRDYDMQNTSGGHFLYLIDN